MVGEESEKESDQMIIQEIPYESALFEATRKLRDEVLRRPIGLTLSAADIEGENHQIHIAAIDDSGDVRGTVILKPLSESLVKLRQMSVSPACQGQGCGKQLVRFAERVALERGYKLIELAARISALGFYEKLGYRTEGEKFTEVTLPTIKMVKALDTTG
ncbi:MAG TPA: GNAT family N-acetyltransferase [Alphaproteobacteria bacterium]|jgi:GNAT superfamily N-acetyltransferase